MFDPQRQKSPSSLRGEMPMACISDDGGLLIIPSVEPLDDSLYCEANFEVR